MASCPLLASAVSLVVRGYGMQISRSCRHCVPQVSSSDFTVVDGVLKIRGSESSDSGRRLAGEATVTPTGTVGVRMSMQRRKLSSTLPDEYFKELKHFEVTNDFGRCCANYCAVLAFHNDECVARLQHGTGYQCGCPHPST